MQADLEKRAIRTAFGRAADGYDSGAHVQRRIADALLALCRESTGIALDAGCGTGYASEKLRALGATCLSLDLARPMLLHTRSDAICGDIEALPLGKASIALYYSSLAWQWADSVCASTEAARVLQPAGQLVVATLGPNTFMELREAFKQADDLAHVRRFVEPTEHAAQLAAAGFESVRIRRESFVVHAPDLRSLLRDIKLVGAHVVDASRPQGLFGLRRFRRAESWYERLREDTGLPLTYDAVFITATRAAHG